MADMVNHPAHYKTGNIEVIDYIEDKKLGYHLGNAVKYISRAGVKYPDKYTEDLEKAIWYIKREIDLHKKIDDALQKLINDSPKSFPKSFPNEYIKTSYIVRCPCGSTEWRCADCGSDLEEKDIIKEEG